MTFDYVSILKAIPAAIIGLTIHEFSHAWMCNRLGDSTAKDQGRLTLNPIKHIDPLGFILIIVAGFGWAKPVQFNPENLRKKNRDEILIALAGPISNLILGFLLFIIARILFFVSFFSQNKIGFEIIKIMFTWGLINFGLFVFNLIPIPPLDGSHIYTTFLKDMNPKLMAIVHKYGTWGLMIIIIAENRFKIDILPISSTINFLMDFSIKMLKFN